MTRFPRTNKIRQTFSEDIGENAKLLEENLKRIDWRLFGKAYAIGFTAFTFSLFVIIVTVKFALSLF